QLADGSRRVRSHDDAVDLALVRVGKDFVGGQPGAHHHLTTEACFAGASRERLKILLLAARCRGVVIVSDAGRLRRGHDQRVVSMKKDEIRAELLGLCEREREGFLVGWYL